MGHWPLRRAVCPCQRGTKRSISVNSMGKRNRTFGCISGTQILHFCNSVEHPETFWNMRDSVSALRALGCSIVRLHLCVACVLCGRSNTVLTLQGVQWRHRTLEGFRQAIIPACNHPNMARARLSNNRCSIVVGLHAKSSFLRPVVFAHVTHYSCVAV